jgi:hypothetical protein
MRVSRRILPWVLCASPALLLSGPLFAQRTPAQTTTTRQTPERATSERTMPEQPTVEQATADEATPVQIVRGRGVTVERSPVVVTRKRFDPRDPPAEMPPLGPNADAITQSRFGCAASVQYTVVSRRPEGRGRRGVERGGCTATARVDSVRVTLDLDVTIWVPTTARPKLVAHEEGHRVISERVYDDAAADAALAEAQKLVGRTVTARGDNCEAAADAAIKAANEEFCQAYLDATSAWSTRVGNRYDDITSHGKRSDPGVDEAIRQSFEQEPQVELVRR